MKAQLGVFVCKLCWVERNSPEMLVGTWDFHRSNRCLRGILRIFWPAKVSNQKIYSRVEVEPVTALIKKRKWGSIGQTLRRLDKRSSWIRREAEKGGRPKVKCKSTVNKELDDAGVSWSDSVRTALNRTIRRVLCVFSEAPRSYFGPFFFVHFLWLAEVSCILAQ